MALGKINTSTAKTVANGSITNPPQPDKGRIAGTLDSTTSEDMSAQVSAESPDKAQLNPFVLDREFFLRPFNGDTNSPYLGTEEHVSNFSGASQTDNVVTFQYSGGPVGGLIENQLIVLFDTDKPYNKTIGNITTTTADTITIEFANPLPGSLGEPDNILHLSDEYFFEDIDEESISRDQEPYTSDSIRNRNEVNTRLVATAIRANQWSETLGDWTIDPGASNDTTGIGLVNDNISLVSYNLGGIPKNTG